MFAFELKGKIVEIVGIGREKEIQLIEDKKIFLKRNQQLIPFSLKTIKEKDFPKGENFDALFITTKNPVREVVRFYYQRIKEKKLKIPALFLSQNGIEAGEEAKEVLKEIFEKEAEIISIFRISLFNPVEKKIIDDGYYLEYSLPIRLAIAQISGQKREEFFQIFEKEKFEIYKISSPEAKNMEYSKLFLNLIGTVSASYQFSLREGLEKKEILFEEVKMLKEYVKIVKRAGGKFLNFPHYPVKFFSFLISFLPFFCFYFLRKLFLKMIEKGRERKEKNLEEIDYYNGAVVKLGKKLNIPTPINEKILQRVKK